MSPVTQRTETLERLAKEHPCYTEQARLNRGRIHLAVAPACNLGCNYCERAVGPRARLVKGPGTAAKVLSPEEAALLVDRVAAEGWLSVVGIAGPGEPLFNPQTFDTLRLVKRNHPELLLCVSTNGLLLSQKLDDLLASGVTALTVTINAVRRGTAEQLYAWALLHGRREPGHIAAPLTLKRQWTGLAEAIEAGLLVKVNSVLVPGVTDRELAEVARRAGQLGAARHNIMPLIPRGRMRHIARPDPDMVEGIRAECSRYLIQFRGCQQCQADVIAPPMSLAQGVCRAQAATTEA
jgi:nitrogen fixation protein NifB